MRQEARYESVIPEMAETVSVSRSSVSREASQAAEAELEKLLDRDWTQIELLVIYLDGLKGSPLTNMPDLDHLRAAQQAPGAKNGVNATAARAPHI